MSVLMAVDTDNEVHEQHIPAWAEIGVDVQRVDTMQEAIIQLAEGGEFLFIAINEDSIPDYLSQLPILGDVAKQTNTPIFVFTSIFTPERKPLIIGNGADAYVPHGKCASVNIQNVLALLKLHGKWTKRPAKKLPVLVGGDIVLSLPRRKVYVDGIEIALTKKEFDILRYFLSNDGIVLTYRQIYSRIWGNGYDDEAHDLVWNHVRMLRHKIEQAAGETEYIANERDVGYCFSTLNYKQPDIVT